MRWRRPPTSSPLPDPNPLALLMRLAQGQLSWSVGSLGAQAPPASDSSSPDWRESSMLEYRRCLFFRRCSSALLIEPCAAVGLRCCVEALACGRPTLPTLHRWPHFCAMDDRTATAY